MGLALAWIRIISWLCGAIIAVIECVPKTACLGVLAGGERSPKDGVVVSAILLLSLEPITGILVQPCGV